MLGLILFVVSLLLLGVAAFGHHQQGSFFWNLWHSKKAGWLIFRVWLLLQAVGGIAGFLIALWQAAITPVPLR